MSILEKILESKRKEIEEKKNKRPFSELKKRWVPKKAARYFKGSLDKDKIQLIGELKKASPVNGVLRQAFDPVALAASYEHAGAAALSVLTDEPFFGGQLSYLEKVKAAVKLPLLRKDFILDEYQIYESAEASADAVLLISSLLSEEELSLFIRSADTLGIASLVEVHTEDDLEKSLAAEASIIGINNRDLQTFEVDLNTSERLAERVPSGTILVSESGIHSADEVRHLEELGFHAVLIGQAFMERPDLEKAVREVMGR